jgi:cob(I)alamin adenosyltransferase
MPRLTRITTRTGDDGTTGLAGNARRRKDDARIEVIGEVDELNSQLGVLLSEAMPETLREHLIRVQHHLFDLGGELAMPEYPGMTEGKLAWLDARIAADNAELPALREFILPGGSRPASLAHVCRTVCRRAERRAVALAAQESLSPLVVQYLNRLSDWLFVLSRVLNREAGAADRYWTKALS